MHSFVIMAYGQSAFLEKTIKSILNQTKKSRVHIASSTPNRFLSEISEKYDIPLAINKGSEGIYDDWNFGLDLAETRYVTLAHQDDIYHKQYTEVFLTMAEKDRDFLIMFSDYSELLGDIVSEHGLNLIIKKMLLSPYLIKKSIKNKTFKKISISLGSPICCPSVMYNKSKLDSFRFEKMEVDLDWAAWHELSRRTGSFVYIPLKLVIHRIHSDSQTSRAIRNLKRSSEDYVMFCRFWPKLIAFFLNNLYKLSYISNQKKG